MVQRKNFSSEQAKKISPPPDHITFLLFDIMAKTDPSISEKAMEVMIQLYEFRHSIIHILPSLQIASDDSTFLDIYKTFKSANSQIFNSQSNINSCDDIKNRMDLIIPEFLEIDRRLEEILSKITYPIDQFTLEKQLAATVQAKASN